MVSIRGDGERDSKSEAVVVSTASGLDGLFSRTGVSQASVSKLSSFFSGFTLESLIR